MDKKVILKIKRQKNPRLALCISSIYLGRQEPTRQHSKCVNIQGNLEWKAYELRVASIALAQVARVTTTEPGRTWSFRDSTTRLGLSLGIKKVLEAHSQDLYFG